jgi:structural maintenance of chromosome 1
MDQLKKRPVNIRSEVEGRILENFKVAIPHATHKKFQYQAYMNQKLFDGFDNRSFSTLLEDVEKPPSDFLSMQQAERYRKESFQQFQEYDLRKFTVKMLVENAKHNLFLKKFCFLKFQAIFDTHTENQLFGHLEHSNCILQMEKHPNTPFYTSFCKFAVSVWLVHRLAFAFKTPATTFIVEEGLPFDCLKMESAGPADDITPDSRVGFVVLPGFQVSQSTIPCEVYLVEKTQDTPVVGGQVTHLQTLNACHENSTTGN